MVAVLVLRDHLSRELDASRADQRAEVHRLVAGLHLHPDAFEAAGTYTEFVPLASLEGHDAFLVDIEPFSAAIGRFLA